MSGCGEMPELMSDRVFVTLLILLAIVCAAGVIIVTCALRALKVQII